MVFISQNVSHRKKIDFSYDMHVTYVPICFQFTGCTYNMQNLYGNARLHLTAMSTRKLLRRKSLAAISTLVLNCSE
ncbi:hypothetical protein P8452_10938 [Trifolium repens]|nr:hypothetical protein P8452_10938 [Trifolium repens]